MIIGLERYQLEDELTKVLYKINKDGNLLDELLNRMARRGYYLGYTQSIVSGNKLLQTLKLIDLSVIAYEVYNVTLDNRLYPHKWFTDVEIKNIEIYKNEEEEEHIEFPLVLDRVVEVIPGAQWITAVPMTYLAKLWNANKIEYNFETQRDPKLIYADDVIVKTPNINHTAVNEIGNGITEGRYKPNTITLNVLRDSEGTDYIEYDREKLRLTIHSGILNILDGFHRSLGILAALLNNAPNLNFELRIVNWDKYNAAEFVRQEDIRNKISEDHLESIDMSKKSNIVVKNLNSSVNSDLRGKIATDKSMIKNNLALTMYTTMTTTISKLWALKTNKDATDLSDYLIAFFNELIGLYPHEFIEKIEETKKKSYISHETMFIFYLVLANMLQGKDNWKSKLKIVMEQTDFSKNNKFWSKIGATATSSNQIRRFSNNIIKESKILLKGVISND